MRSARITTQQPVSQQRRTFAVESHDPLRQAEIDHRATVTDEWADRARARIREHARDESERVAFLKMLGLDK